MTMNTKVSFFIRFLVIFGLALILIAAVPTSASNVGSLKNLVAPPGWLAFRPPLTRIMDIDVTLPDPPTTTEGGGTATISVVLTEPAPIEDVTITVSSLNTSEGNVEPAQLVFTPANYATSQNITVTGEDDDVDDEDIAYKIQLSASSADTYYDGYILEDIDLTNINDDTAGITVSPTTGLVTDEDGGQATFNVVLTSEPTDDVTINLTSSDPSEGTIDEASLTFTSANWFEDQIVTITGEEDAIADGDVPYTIVLNPTSDDTTYNIIVPDDISVTNNDNGDTAGITVDPTDGLVTDEDGLADSFTVVLNSEPTADVTIGITGDANEGTIDPASLAFNSSNWNVPQEVIVTGVDDLVDDGDVTYDIILANPTGDDATYNAIVPDTVSVTNNDNGDTAGITVSAISGPTTEVSGDVEPTFTIVLNSKPTGNVTIGLTSSDTSEGTVSPASLTFTASNWITPQSAIVTGVNDDVDDGDINFNIITANPTGSDSLYNAINPADVPVTNIDDDTAGISVIPTTGLITDEDRGQATFTVVLTSEPTDDITIGLTSNDTSEGTIDKASLTFTSENWFEAQTVTITGEDDDQIDGDIAYKIVLANPTGGDDKYNIINPADVSVINEDNDVAGFIVNPTSGLGTREDGLKAYFTVVLENQPTTDVILPLQSSDTTEGTVSPGSLSFTPDNWDKPQTVTITGKDDFIHDGSISYKILTKPATSGDTYYEGVDAEDVSVTNLDDDTPGFLITPGDNENTPLYTSEGEASTAINIFLSTEPTAEVDFTFTSMDTSEGVFSQTHPNQTKTITFTPTNWNTMQTIQLFGVDDTEVDGDFHYTVDVQSSSADSDYNAQSRELFAINMDAPTIEWVLPKNHHPYYEICSPGMFLLGVKPISKEPMSRVYFYRYDDKLGQFVDIGIAQGTPYLVNFDPQFLNYDWNQIYAYATDTDKDNIQSIHEHLLIYRLPCIFLPTINK